MESSEVTDGRSALSVEVGGRLRERRQELGNSIRATAEAAAISPGHLSEIENGISHASLPVLLRLGRVLDYPLAELLPRIGGHRVHQALLSPDGATETDLSHPDLDLEATGLRLVAGEVFVQHVNRQQDALLYVLFGECVIDVGSSRYTLRARDSADIEHASQIDIHATTDTLIVVVLGERY